MTFRVGVIGMSVTISNCSGHMNLATCRAAKNSLSSSKPSGARRRFWIVGRFRPFEWIAAAQTHRDDRVIPIELVLDVVLVEMVRPAVEKSLALVCRAQIRRGADEKAAETELLQRRRHPIYDVAGRLETLKLVDQVERKLRIISQLRRHRTNTAERRRNSV